MTDKPYKKDLLKIIQEVYNDLPGEFYAHQLTDRVRSKIYSDTNKFPYAETVARYFRELRGKGLIKCECRNRQDSLYRKVIHINSK